MSTLVPAWRSVKPSGPEQRQAVWVAQKHAVTRRVTPAFSPAAKRRARITGTKSICVISSLPGSIETRGGASSNAAAIILPSKSSKQVPVNPRNGIRCTCNNLAFALSVLGTLSYVSRAMPSSGESVSWTPSASSQRGIAVHRHRDQPSTLGASLVSNCALASIQSIP